MKSTLLTAVAAVAVFAAGCNKSPEGGSPGTKDSFKLSAPVMATTIKQGDRQTVTVSLDRGSDFKKDVRLEAEAPKGLTAKFANNTVKASDAKDAALTIEADKDATVGDHVVTVTGTPDGGTKTSVQVKVSVAAK